MLGISYGELFLLLGATAALIGPKDLPLIARTAGRLAGRAIGYVQLARGQFDNIMQQTQAKQVHKELQDTLAQLEAIRHEIRAVSFINPGPMTRRLVDNISQTSPDEISNELGSSDNKNILTSLDAKVCQTDLEINNSVAASDLSNMHTQATTYARLAQSTTVLTSESKKDGEVINELTDESGLFVVLPVSAESTGMLPERKVDVKGSDVVLEAILEANVACNAKQFFAEHQKTN